jgi:hypothetical protein
MDFDQVVAEVAQLKRRCAAILDEGFYGKDPRPVCGSRNSCVSKSLASTRRTLGR